MGAAEASPRLRRGPGRSDNPASSSLPATGLRLVGPAGPLPQPCLGAELHVGSPAEGRGGGLRWPPIVRSVRRSVSLLAGRCAPLHPILHPGPSVLCRRCFPLPVFFPALAPPRAAWSGGSGGAPQEAGVLFLYHHPPFRPPVVSLKNFGQSDELGGRPGGLLPQVSTVCQEESLPYLWDPGVPSGTSQSQPFLSVCCPFTLFCSVLNPSRCQLFSPCLTVPPCSRGPATPKLSWCRPVVP